MEAHLVLKCASDHLKISLSQVITENKGWHVCFYSKKKYEICIYKKKYWKRCKENNEIRNLKCS